MSSRMLSWGRNRVYNHHVLHPQWLHEIDLNKNFSDDLPILAYGLGRSYGDACLNQDSHLIATSALRRMISFDSTTGILQCEAGVSIADIIAVFMPKGWFPPVVPGTKYVTIGGAIAHDIHGKNHHRRGSFGNHVLHIELKTSDGKTYQLAKAEANPLFDATIGGMGLTGLITKASIQLIPISSAYIDCEHIKMKRFEDYEELVSESDETYEYTVAWIDSTAPKSQLGRGIFMRGNHSSGNPNELASYNAHRVPLVALPFESPVALVNDHTVPLLCAAYYHRMRALRHSFRSDFDSFFFPLDKISNWNYAFGKRGFYQYQCVVPQNSLGLIRKILETVAKVGAGSFVTVLKSFGEQKSPGMMSFPMAGPTITFDFADNGEKVCDLMNHLDEMVSSFGGRVYTAKDARMSPAFFQSSYPNLSKFKTHIDPRFSSSLWRRLNE